MNSSRPVPWVSQVLYGSVLVAGLYAELAGLGDTNLPVFLAGFAALVMVEVGDSRGGAGRWAVFVARAVLLVVLAVADGSGMARILLVLIPFHAYFVFGRRASVWVGAGCVGLAVAGSAWAHPGLLTDVEQLSDLLMFALGVTLAIAMAAAAVDERRYRARIAALSAAEERNRVARDIHDGLGHHLTAIIVQLEKAAAFRDRDPPGAQHALDNAARSAKHALNDVRRSVTTLHTHPGPDHTTSNHVPNLGSTTPNHLPFVARPPYPTHSASSSTLFPSLNTTDPDPSTLNANDASTLIPPLNALNATDPVPSTPIPLTHLTHADPSPLARPLTSVTSPDDVLSAIAQSAPVTARDLFAARQQLNPSHSDYPVADTPRNVTHHDRSAFVQSFNGTLADPSIHTDHPSHAPPLAGGQSATPAQAQADRPSLNGTQTVPSSHTELSTVAPLLDGARAKPSANAPPQTSAHTDPGLTTPPHGTQANPSTDAKPPSAIHCEPSRVARPDAARDAELSDPTPPRSAIHDGHLCLRHGAPSSPTDHDRLAAAQDVPFSAISNGRFSVVLALRELLHGGDIDLDIRGDEDGHPIAVREVLFRAAQEGITNARRHAQAERIGVVLRFNPGQAELSVVDDGCGFEPGREGFGLRGMHERVQGVGGQVTVHSRPGGGTQIVVTVPVVSAQKDLPR